MAAPIGPDDIVECISGKTLTIGAVYRVHEVVDGPAWCPCHGGSPFGLKISGHANSDGAIGFCGLNFKPIYPGGELTKLLMQPIPAEPERVSA
ncbi:hypothetical protein [Phenylobacterium sp.]|uniref:hypothetical protein n=1 Tax=Phenylobacterium sp. TaxID=1871053 RepID=UPI002FCB63C8